MDDDKAMEVMNHKKPTVSLTVTRSVYIVLIHHFVTTDINTDCPVAIATDPTPVACRYRVVYVTDSAARLNDCGPVKCAFTVLRPVHSNGSD
ncbi:hypothetical protein LSAT2_007110 [Lamellibrachia satsuma]|nr:hypothetical protein LSAT2_007110 [Lamellibrachia satsuma]